MSYRAQNLVSVCIAAVLAGIGVILAGKPEDFLLTPAVVRWLGVVVAVLGVLQTQMSRVTKDRLAGKED